MKIKPLLDRVVLKMTEQEETTVGGLILPGSAQEKPQLAEVVAVGEETKIGDQEYRIFVKPGDKVLFSKYAGTEVKVDGQEYIIVSQKDILAIVEA